MEALQDLIANLIPMIQVAGVFLGAYLILLWAASVMWTYRDIRRRSEDVSVQVMAVILVLILPFVGIPLHMILRPPQTLADSYERELEQEYLRRDIEEKYVCPECQRPIEPDFLLCPHCQTHLRRRCMSCDRAVDLTWSVCPYCGGDGKSSAAHQAATITGAPYPALERPAMK